MSLTTIRTTQSFAMVIFKMAMSATPTSKSHGGCENNSSISHLSIAAAVIASAPSVITFH
jgi:hypothetical protein